MSGGNAIDHTALLKRLEGAKELLNDDLATCENIDYAPIITAAYGAVHDGATTIEEYDSMRQALIAMCDRPSRYTLFGNDRENAGKRAVLIDDIRAIIEGGGKVQL